MNRILILFAHPALEKSRIHCRLAKSAKSTEGVHFHDLYELYPDFNIDVDREQKLLIEHDIIILQHPVYWYSSPAILKEWQDLVLEHGFAYGKGGTALRNKVLLQAVSAGGSKQTYCKAGKHHYTLRQLLRPFEQMAQLCGMKYLPPFAVHGTHDIRESDIDRHAGQYRQLIQRLERQVPDDPSVLDGHYLNSWLESEE